LSAKILTTRLNAPGFLFACIRAGGVEGVYKAVIATNGYSPTRYCVEETLLDNFKAEFYNIVHIFLCAFWFA